MSYLHDENRFQYNGKELEEDFGIDLSDYGARWYDASIGRFTTVDPLASDYSFQSPYAYATNNPVLLRNIMGMGVEDYIDIEKSTGEISVTKADGDDQVRLVDKGKVESSYTYGSNGSFSSNNSIFKDKSGTTIVSTQTSKLNTFYKFAANSDVEFASIEGVNSKGVSVSLVTTSHTPVIDGESATLTVGPLAIALSHEGFIANKISHSHPAVITDYNESAPSGHYDFEKGNPRSLDPFYVKGKKTGDAANAINLRRLPGFGKTKFEVYAPGNKTITTYDGIHKAKIRSY